MKPLLQTVVALCLILAANAHPENIEEVKELGQTKDTILEAEESEPQARIERCTTCSSNNVKLNFSPNDILGALRALPPGEVHSEQSFEGCSTEKGCAGIKVKDGKVVEKFGNADSFKAAAAADTGSEFQFHAAGTLGNPPFWWMNEGSPFKNGGGNFKQFSKASSSYTSLGGAEGTGNADFGASFNLGANPFLNGGSQSASTFSSSAQESYSTSGKGGLDFASNPFLNNGANRFGQTGFQAQGGFGQSNGQSAFTSSGSESKFAGSGYIGSSPRPFTASTASNANFDFDQSQQTFDDAFQSCSGQDYVCVLKNQCNNGVVSANGAGTKKPTCNSRNEVCCRIDARFQGSFTGSGNQGFVGSSSTQTGFGSSTFGSFGAKGSSNSQGVTTSGFGATGSGSFGSSTSAPAFGSTTGYQSTGQSNFIETDVFQAGSENTGVYRPGAIGSGLKPGVPYLPPDNTNSATNLVTSTAYPSPNPVTSPRPTFNTPRPTTPRPTPSRPAYRPSTTAAPGYLPPPIGESSNTKETVVRPPNYNDGSLILDENRYPNPKPTSGPSIRDIPAGCAAALKCTPIEFCTAEGVISNTSVILTRDQENYRVPLTDCKDLESGTIGKCCRDPYYTDPWPTNQLGKWVQGVFGGNDGKYVPDNNVSPDILRPQSTPRPVTGSINLNAYRTKPTSTPFGPNHVTPGYGSTTPSYQKGQGQFNQVSQGSYSQKGQGSYSQKGQGQFGQGQIGQFGQGSQGQFGFAGQGQANSGQGQIGKGTQFTQSTTQSYNQGSTVSQGVGQFGIQGQGQFGTQGQGQISTQGQGQINKQSQGQFGQGQLDVQGSQSQLTQVQKGVQGQGQIIKQGEGQIITQGQGFGTSKGQGQTVISGQGTGIRQGQGFGVTQGQGVLTEGQIVSQGQGVGVTQGQGFGISQTKGQGVIAGQGQGINQGVGVTQGAGFGVSRGQGQVVSQGQGQRVNQGQGFGVTQGQGFGVTQGQGVGISQGQGSTTIRGQGTVSQGQGVGITQGFGASRGEEQLVSQGQGFGITQSKGQGVITGEGQIVSQGQGFGVTQGQGVGVTQGQGLGVTRAPGYGTTQGQGVAGEGQIGFGVSQGQGQGAISGQGQIVSQGQGFGVTQGQGQLVSQGQGVGVGQGQGFGQGQGQGIGQGQGQGIGQGQGFGVGQGQGFGVSQGQGFGVTQGQGQLVSQGQGFGVKQGQGQFGSQGFGIRGEGQIGSQGVGFGVQGSGIGFGVQQGQGLLTSQGFGAKLQQEKGTKVTQGSGTEVENEFSESVQRVFLKKYNADSQCGQFNGQNPSGNHEDQEVDFAEIPWQAMVLLQTNRSLLCGGVITRPDVVVTSAACVEGLEAKNVLIKGGEWKLGIDEEPLPFQIVQVKHILRHPFYKSGSLHFDAAILVLTEDLRLAKNIYPICLPGVQETLDAFYRGEGQCIVTGWGKVVLQAHLEGRIMHSLNVSLIAPNECQAKITQDYPHLLEQYDEESCVCGEPTNPLDNICRVDIGSALACTSGDGHFVMRGVYSWDSGCQSGNQLAGFYKFDVEWYEWAIGLIESVRFSKFTVGTQVTQNKITTHLTSGVKGVQYGGGVKRPSGTKGFVEVGQYDDQVRLIPNIGQITPGQISGQFGQFGQFTSGKYTEKTSGEIEPVDFRQQINSPLQNTFSATYSEKKEYQSEPKIISYTTKPEIVTFTTKPEIYTFTTKPKIVTYTTKPEIFTYTTKPKIVTYTTKPEFVTYTTKPKYISYAASATDEHPSYAVPAVSFNPSFTDLVGQRHNHSVQCKCLDGKKK